MIEAVDNFENMSGWIPEITINNDKFYMVQLIIRKGTNLNHNNSNRSRTIRTYQIRDMRHLREYKKEMIYLCDLTGARAYINLNARLFSRTALIAIKLLSDSVLNGHQHNARAAYSKAIMDCPIDGKKVWVIDFDLKDYESREAMLISANSVMTYIAFLTQNGDERKDKFNPSKDGIHILCNSFRRDIFLKKMADEAVKCELKVDASTNLYIPKDITLPNSDDFPDEIS